MAKGMTIADTGWRRPTGCLKLQVIFGRRATKYRALYRAHGNTLQHTATHYNKYRALYRALLDSVMS